MSAGGSSALPPGDNGGGGSIVAVGLAAPPPRLQWVVSPPLFSHRIAPARQLGAGRWLLCRRYRRGQDSRAQGPSWRPRYRATSFVVWRPCSPAPGALPTTFHRRPGSGVVIADYDRFATFCYFVSRQPTRNIQRRRGPALQAFELLHELVEQPGVLDAFGYFRGTGGHHCPPSRGLCGGTRPGHMRTRRFGASPAGRRPARAGRGGSVPAAVALPATVLATSIADPGRLPGVCEVRVLVARSAQVLPRLTTRPVGRTSVGRADGAIESLWGHRHIIFRLPLVAGSTTVFQTAAASDGLCWAKPAWFRYFGDKVAGEFWR